MISSIVMNCFSFFFDLNNKTKTQDYIYYKNITNYYLNLN